jgi:hypothetical protein
VSGPDDPAVAIETLPLVRSEPWHWVSKFYRPLELEYVDGRVFRLTAAFTYGSVLLARVLEIEAGFLTDFASVPRALWTLLPPTGRYGKAAVLHDDLYRTPGLATRAQADGVFLEAMTELGVSKATRQIMYRGVRWFGRGAYKGGL